MRCMASSIITPISDFLALFWIADHLASLGTRNTFSDVYASLSSSSPSYDSGFALMRS